MPPRSLPHASCAVALCSLAAAALAQTPQLLLDVNPAPGVSSAPSVVCRGPVDGELLVPFDDGVHGSELWRTDGTTAGTTMVADLRPGPLGCIFQLGDSVGGVTIFNVDRGNGSEVWRTDGTAAGTTMLLPAQAGSSNTMPVAGPPGSGVFFFVAGGQLWRTDGTAAGTTVVYPGVAMPVGPWLGFTLFHVLNGDVVLSDGTSTHVIGPLAGSLQAGSGGRLLQSVFSFPTLTTTFTRLDLPGQPSVTASFLVGAIEMPDAFLLVSPGSFGTGWLRWDGASPPQVVGGFTAIGPIRRFGRRLAFDATTAAGGNELWITDGTAAGTIGLDLVPGTGGSAPLILGELGDRLVFVAAVNTNGREPWITDGTLAGTVSLGDLEPGPASSDIGGYGTIGERRAVLSVRTAALGKELWLTNGTAAGTTLLADIAPGPASSIITPGGFIAGFGWFAGATLYFPADDGVHGREPWILPTTGTRTPLRAYGPRSFTTGDPVLGAVCTLRCAGLQPGELGVVAIGSPVAACTPVAPLRCIHLDPATAVLVATIVGGATGEWTGTFALSNQPAAVGLDLVAQPLFLAPPMPLGVDVGDAVWLSLGY